MHSGFWIKRALTIKMLLCLCLLHVGSLVAQLSPIRVHINGGIDTANADIAEVIQLWKHYLNSKPDSVYDNPYWLGAEKKRYAGKFDLLNSTYYSPSLYAYLPYWRATIMSVSRIDSGFAIRTVLAFTDSGFSHPECITEVGAVKEDGAYKLCNMLPINTRVWKKEKVGSISFIFPNGHEFDRTLALRLNSFVDSLTGLWSIRPFDVDYYLAENLDILYKALGFDYHIGEGNLRGASGSSDARNRIVYGAGQNEYYPHEFVHIYMSPLNLNSHGWFSEGYATLLGGSKGHELSWHLKRADQYLREHPQLNLDTVLAFWHMDYYTDPIYVFGGLLCKMADEQGGLPLLKRLMSYGKSDADFYRAVQAVFGVPQKSLNNFLRRKIAEYAAK
ncbi:MAG TPA: hypothetical protein VES59_03275 [Bacteroidota bacterium]|nr:hypothetical protein [Bacteroidota bacterium]